MQVIRITILDKSHSQESVFQNELFECRRLDGLFKEGCP